MLIFHVFIGLVSPVCPMLFFLLLLLNNPLLYSILDQFSPLSSTPSEGHETMYIDGAIRAI